MSKARTPCADVPYFDRLNYFYGQMLGVRELTSEQTYFREKLKLHNRCLHGYGTVCGLVVTPDRTEPDCDPDDDHPQDVKPPETKPVDPRPYEPPLGRPLGPGKGLDPGMLVEPGGTTSPKVVIGAGTPGRPGDPGDDNDKGGGITAVDHSHDRPHVFVHCGLALDCEGNELVVRSPIPVDLVASLSSADRDRLSGLSGGERRDGVTFYISLCFCEQPLDPLRPIVADACGSTSGCEYGRYRDSVSVRVTLEAPEDDTRCEPCCCGECSDCCLLLARIDHVLSGKPIAPGDIHNGVRRMLGPYSPTTITGISWTHGATYSKKEVALLLGLDDDKSGLVISFSRGVHVSTFKPGVIDLTLIAGGGGVHGPVRAIDMEYVGLPATGYVDRVTFRQKTDGEADYDDEPHDFGDRIFITVRSPFLLDRCCQPVFGANVGGRIPILPEFAAAYDRSDKSDAVPCRLPRNHYGPWTSDPRGGPVNFESWFYVEEKQRRSTK